MKNKQGVTLIELIIAISILSIVTALSIVSYNKWQQQVFLTNQVDELKSAISKTQQLAVASAQDTNWGVHFEDTQYIIFAGSSYNEVDPDNEIHNLQGVTIVDYATTLSDGIGGYGPDLIFNKFTGQTNNTGTLSLMPTTNAEITQTITIYEVGQLD
jgi:prepilin-type N-terminal cleavage/methylation domain-containing protein